MSATRDKNQKSTFVYSNLYHLFKTAQTSATKPPVPGIAKGEVIKAESLNQEGPIQVRPFQPAELIGKRLQKPAALKKASIAQPVSKTALDSLKDNLKTLNDLHARLRFMLQELEDLVKD